MNFENNQMGHMATHSAKLFHRKGTQAPICANIQAQIPPTYISSATVKLERFTWSDPLQIESNERVNITDVKTKQITVSYNNNMDNLAITPMTAIGLYYELYNRENALESSIFGNKLMDLCIEFNSRSLSDYNEVIQVMDGHVKAFITPDIKIQSLSVPHSIDLDKNCFGLTIQLKNANLSSNMIAVGLPSITAIGGFFMYMEQRTGIQADFAIGIKRTNKNILDELYGKKTKLRGLRGFASSIDQKNGDIELTFIIRCKSLEETEYLKTWIQTNDFKIAGGEVVSKKIADNIQDDCCWLYEADPSTVQSDMKQRDVLDIPCNADALDYALILNRTNHYNSENKYTITANGYAFLGNPEFDPYSRAQSGLHVWAEVIFSVIYLKGKFDPEKCFWSKRDKVENGLMYWTSLS
jgi:hypothetical protein